MIFLPSKTQRSIRIYSNTLPKAPQSFVTINTPLQSTVFQSTSPIDIPAKKSSHTQTWSDVKVIGLSIISMS